MFTILFTFIGVIIMMILGMPIAFAFATGGLFLFVIFGISPMWGIRQSTQIISGYTLLASPLYLLLGIIIRKTNMAEGLIDVANALLRKVKGGMGIAVIIANGFFGAMSGSAMSALGGLGKAFLPVMEKKGYPQSYGISILIPSAVLSLLIPPSSNMIMFGYLGQISITRCFLAGIIPGIVLMFFLSLTHIIIFRKFCPNINEQTNINFEKQTKLIGSSIKENFFTLTIPVVVLGSIYSGLATPTESASIAVVYSLIIGLFIYRSIKISDLVEIFYDASKLSGSIILLVFFFLFMSRVLIIEQVSETLLAIMMQVTTNKYGIMGIICLILFFLGMIVDDGSVVIISAILFLPVVREIGFDPYQFMVISILMSGLGLITPPVAPLLYLGGYLAGNLPMEKYIKPTMLFSFFGFFPTIILVIFFPKISTYLVYLFKG